MLIRTANCLYYSDQVNLIDQSYQGWEKHEKDLLLFLVLHVMRTAFEGFQRHCSFVMWTSFILINGKYIGIRS